MLPPVNTLGYLFLDCHGLVLLRSWTDSEEIKDNTYHLRGSQKIKTALLAPLMFLRLFLNILFNIFNNFVIKYF